MYVFVIIIIIITIITIIIITTAIFIMNCLPRILIIHICNKSQILIMSVGVLTGRWLFKHTCLLEKNFILEIQPIDKTHMHFKNMLSMGCVQGRPAFHFPKYNQSYVCMNYKFMSALIWMRCILPNF